ncbi:MAG: hypothetical protein MUF84_16810 [Anaerolineae bacterium]|nr:hypothetical protein [Anaerolineae bacterium]
MAIGGTAFDVEVLPDDRSFVGCLKAYAPAERGRVAPASYTARWRDDGW